MTCRFLARHFNRLLLLLLLIIKRWVSATNTVQWIKDSLAIFTKFLLKLYYFAIIVLDKALYYLQHFSFCNEVTETNSLLRRCHKIRSNFLSRFISWIVFTLLITHRTSFAMNESTATIRVRGVIVWKSYCLSRFGWFISARNAGRYALLTTCRNNCCILTVRAGQSMWWIYSWAAIICFIKCRRWFLRFAEHLIIIWNVTNF